MRCVGASGHKAERSSARSRPHRLRMALQWLLLGLVALIALLTAAAALYDATSRPSVAVPPPDAHGHEVQTGDVRTRYEQWGRHGPVLVMIPGFVESSFVWRRVGPMLGRRFRVYALDVRGFGYTTHRAPYTLDADTAQLAAFLTALHLDAAHGSRPVLVGHSSGAAIAANLARQRPGAVAGVVFADGDGTSAGAGPGWVHGLIVDPYFTAVLRLALRHPIVIRAVWNSVCGPYCPPLTGTELDGWRRPLEVPGAEGALKAIVEAPLIGLSPRELATIRVPAAVLRGAGDPALTASQARSIAGWVRAREIVTVPRARHLPMISNPHRFAADMTAIARSLAGRTAAGPSAA